MDEYQFTLMVKIIIPIVIAITLVLRFKSKRKHNGFKSKPVERYKFPKK
jgi:hypothetical protein